VLPDFANLRESPFLTDNSRDSHDRQIALGPLRSALIPWLATINPNIDQLRWLGIQRYGGTRADFDLGADPVA
jgi:hypothetical protein